MKSIKSINEIFLLTVVTGLAGSVLYQFLGLDKCDYYVSLLYSQILLILPAVCYVIWNRLPLKELLRIRPIKIGAVFWLILFAYLIMPLMQEINLISMLFAKNTIGNKMYAIVENKPFLFSLLLIAGVPALLEESVYRGVFFHTYSIQSPRKAILFSGLLFGLMHMNFNQFSYAFVMGAIFCLLIEATDSILSSMIIHFIINGTSVVMLYVTPYLQRFMTKITALDNQSVVTDVNSISKSRLLASIISYGVIAVFSTGLAVLVYIAIAKHQGRLEHVKSIFQRNKTDSSVKEAKILSTPLLIGIVICMLYMILNELA